MRRVVWLLPAVLIGLSACGAGAPAAQGPVFTPASQAPASASASQRSQATASSSPRPSTKPSATHSASPVSNNDPTAPPTVAMAPDGGPGEFAPTGTGVLTGKTILIDPGHNGGNFYAASTINKLIWNGRENETCDTTGAETDGGYTEAEFNWNVARYVTAILRAEGAQVVLTRTSNTGVGPCVTERTQLGNEVHANAALSIHADGGPAGGRGFAILEPVADGINDAIVAPSAVLGADLRTAFLAGTGEPYSTYDGVNAIQPRDDLAGTNLSTVPKVFIECANMRNAADAALVTSQHWQAIAARAIAAGLAAFVTGQ
jgi:N-acetylmuramoyl-L-alanine amidase